MGAGEISRVRNPNEKQPSRPVTAPKRNYTSKQKYIGTHLRRKQKKQYNGMWKKKESMTAGDHNLVGD